MSEPEKKTTNKNVNMRIAYLVFITLLLLIIIFASSLLFSGKKDDDTVKGEGVISTGTATTALSDVTGTAAEIVSTRTVTSQTVSALNSVSSVKESDTVTATTNVSSVQITTAKSIVTQPATVQYVTSPRPAVSPTRPYDDSEEIPETTSESTTVNNSLITLTFYECSMEVGDEPKMPLVTMSDTIEDKSEKWESSDESVATVDYEGNITAVGSGVCTIRVSSVSNPEVYAEVTVTVGNGIPSETENTDSTESTTAPQTDEPTYIGGILIANKTYALPSDYNPGLDSETESAFYELSEAAAEEGLDIYLSSGFRSYETQDRIYNNYVSNYGQESADTFSARPGHSEHQTGLAIDVNSIDDSFADTPEAVWLADHAHEYGFIIRYPQGKEHITGYKYEPWHIRYLGIETATEVYNSGLTLEEFLGIDSVYKN
ncbi:MAG: M15 family metallopeptidase [Oscillospiraceae bacterium]|nr:M15 family metallopeptidase [Oscillospiraceae bacterium]